MPPDRIKKKEMESKRYGKRKVGMPKKDMENGINEIAKKVSRIQTM